MELPGEPAVTGGADGTRSAAGADAGIVVAVTRTNPMYGRDAPLVRVIAHGEPDPVTAAVARCVGESGSAYLELPRRPADGRPGPGRHDVGAAGSRRGHPRLTRGSMTQT